MESQVKPLLDRPLWRLVRYRVVLQNAFEHQDLLFKRVCSACLSCLPGLPFF